MPQLRGLLIDVKNKRVTDALVDDEPEVFHNILDTSTIDICTRPIGKRLFRFVCDDEGLYKDPVIPSYTHSEAGELVGNIFVVSHTTTLFGSLMGLSDEDVDYILPFVKEALFKGSTQPSPIIKAD